MCCRGTVDGPFVVINADDYYGGTCFRLLYDFLTGPQDGARLHLADVYKRQEHDRADDRLSQSRR